MKKILNEFKKFISKGNALDLAVGVVVGGAFSKIVSSLVNDVIMPLIGVIIGGIDFTNLSLKVGEATVNYGMFIQNIIDFLIISFCIFDNKYLYSGFSFSISLTLTISSDKLQVKVVSS